MQGKKNSPVQGTKKKARVSVSNKVTIDAVNPIPFEYGGTTFSFINNAAYLPFLPPNDNFGQMLLESRLLSTTHNACVTTKKDYCAGIGFHDTEGKELDAGFIEWVRSVNLRNESANKVNKKIFEDNFTYGNVPIEIARFTVAGKKKLFIYPHNFLEWRLCKPNSDDIVTHAIQSKLFLRKGYVTADILKQSKKLPIYNPMLPEKSNWVRDEKGVERTLIWYKNSVTGFPYYGLPSAISSMINQLLEYKAARFNLDNFDNNMVVAGILALRGSLGQEEANKIGKRIINQHTGDGKRGRIFVTASEQGIDGSDFHRTDVKTDGSYNESDDKWTQKIILANEWDAVLAGIISPSTLGKGSGFLTKIMEIKLNTVIRPAQNDLISEVWSHIFKIAQEWLGFPLDQYNIAIENSIDISGLTDVDITPAVTRNEVRKAKGLQEDPTKKGQEYMKSTGPQNNGPKDKKEKEEEEDV